MRHTLMTATVLVTATFSAGATKPRAIPVPAAIMARAVADLSDEEGARRKPNPRIFQPVNVNHDGIADWLIDYSKAGIAGLCGTGGCGTIIYVSASSGAYVNTFDMQTRNFKITPSGPKTRLDTDVHGSNCGSFGAAECQLSYSWDQANGRWTEVANIKGDGRILGGMLKKADPSAPASVEAAGTLLARTCVAAGGNPADDAPLWFTVPDVNSDGMRDWVINAPMCMMPDDKAPPVPTTRIMVTTAAGPKEALAFTSSRYQIDVAQLPSGIIQLTDDPCGDASGCAEKLWFWVASKATFAIIVERPAKPIPAS
jgi:hypothetical protein